MALNVVTGGKGKQLGKPAVSEKVAQPVEPEGPRGTLGSQQSATSPPQSASGSQQPAAGSESRVPSPVPQEPKASDARHETPDARHETPDTQHETQETDVAKLVAAEVARQANLLSGRITDLDDKLAARTRELEEARTQLATLQATVDAGIPPESFRAFEDILYGEALLDEHGRSKKDDKGNTLCAGGLIADVDHLVEVVRGRAETGGRRSGGLSDEVGALLGPDLETLAAAYSDNSILGGMNMHLAKVLKDLSTLHSLYPTLLTRVLAPILDDQVDATVSILYKYLSRGVADTPGPMLLDHVYSCALGRSVPITKAALDFIINRDLTQTVEDLKSAEDPREVDEIISLIKDRATYCVQNISEDKWAELDALSVAAVQNKLREYFAGIPAKPDPDATTSGGEV